MVVRVKPVCIYCHVPLALELGRGFVHPGGAIYIQDCRSCGQRIDAPNTVRCPRCGSTDLVDNHCATPKRS